MSDTAGMVNDTHKANLLSTLQQNIDTWMNPQWVMPNTFERPTVGSKPVLTTTQQPESTTVPSLIKEDSTDFNLPPFIGAAAGGSVGAILLVVAMVLLLYMKCRKRGSNLSKSDSMENFRNELKSIKTASILGLRYKECSRRKSQSFSGFHGRHGVDNAGYNSLQKQRLRKSKSFLETIQEVGMAEENDISQAIKEDNGKIDIKPERGPQQSDEANEYVVIETITAAESEVQQDSSGLDSDLDTKVCRGNSTDGMASESDLELSWTNENPVRNKYLNPLPGEWSKKELVAFNNQWMQEQQFYTKLDGYESDLETSTDDGYPGKAGGTYINFSDDINSLVSTEDDKASDDNESCVIDMKHTLKQWCHSPLKRTNQREHTTHSVDWHLQSMDVTENGNTPCWLLNHGLEERPENCPEMKSIRDSFAHIEKQSEYLHLRIYKQQDHLQTISAQISKLDQCDTKRQLFPNRSVPSTPLHTRQCLHEVTHSTQEKEHINETIKLNTLPRTKRSFRRKCCVTIPFRGNEKKSKYACESSNGFVPMSTSTLSETECLLMAKDLAIVHQHTARQKLSATAHKDNCQIYNLGITTQTCDHGQLPRAKSEVLLEEMVLKHKNDTLKQRRSLNMYPRMGVRAVKSQNEGKLTENKHT